MQILVGLFDSSSNPILGGSALTDLRIRRNSDGFIFDWNDSTFKNVGWTNIFTTMTEISQTNLPGYYKKDVIESTWNDGLYLIVFTYTGADKINGSKEFQITNGKVLEEFASDSLVTISDDQKRLLGLVHENIYIDESIYDENNNMISARLRIYSNSLSVGTNSNIIATYRVTADCNEAGKFVSWQQVEE
jgi:hypothetical protein